MNNTEPAFSGCKPEEKAMTDDVALLRCKGCGHFYEEPPTTCDCSFGAFEGDKWIARHQPEPVAVDIEAIIKRLMKNVGMPDSVSLYTAFKQFHNEISRNLLKGGV